MCTCTCLCGVLDDYFAEAIRSMKNIPTEVTGQSRDGGTLAHMTMLAADY